jgi:hypothetical protein
MNLFAPTIFLGAFLLFQIQPLMAKFILPWFGGGPGVWTVCMLFFQTALLAGYAYAHGLTQFFSRRTQAGIHMALLLVALAFLPIVPGAHWKPVTNGDPTWRILLLLTCCLGLPYFVLAATGPLMQEWFSRLHPGVVPYRLYALSNLGSLLALISYPFVFEPALTRLIQARLWTWGLVGFVMLCGACAWRLWRAKPPDKLAKTIAGSNTNLPEVRPPGAAVKVWWFALPACGSVLLLATTNKLCQDMPPIPFLWVLPLSLYLLTFIICFDRPAWYSRKIFMLLLVPLLVVLCHTLLTEDYLLSLRWQILIYGGNLFAGCMVCHGEVYRLKPAPNFLTSFYLLIAAGGAAGGVFVGILSPLLFQSYAELNWGFWLLGALVLGICIREKIKVSLQDGLWPLWPVALTGVLALGAALLIQSRRAALDTVSTSRNFYGVLRVIEANQGNPYHVYKLNHGGTTHGLQFTDPSHAALATTYFNKPSGVGVVLDNFPRQNNRHVGVIGLGTGTLATYGRLGDTFSFYEINPDVEWLAETRFTFLKKSLARVELISGDARLSMEREPPQEFDVLVLDAFTSDSIPVHLLTREAFKIYFRHLKPDGVIAVHISNRHLDLLPVMVGVAKQFHLLIMEISWDDANRPWWFSSYDWVILSRNEPFMQSEPMISHATPMPDQDTANVILWTDDYASLFPVFRR